MGLGVFEDIDLEGSTLVFFFNCRRGCSDAELAVAKVETSKNREWEFETVRKTVRAEL